MKGTCKSLTELEYFCEEVYKATTEKLDWINPEGRQYPHDLRQPLPLVPNSQGRRVIPFHHFINNDLEYLRGGVSSRKYSTSVTKTTAADYGHIKWIEDLVPNSISMHLRPQGISRDVYSKRRIIAVTKVELVKVNSKTKDPDIEICASSRAGKACGRSSLGVERLSIRTLNLTKPDTVKIQSEKTRAIDKRLKTKEDNEEFERFVGGQDHTGVTYGYYKGPYDLSYVVLIFKRLLIFFNKAYLKSVSLKQRFPRKSFSKKHRVHKESVSKQGRKFTKGESSVLSKLKVLYDKLKVMKSTMRVIEEKNKGTERSFKVLKSKREDKKRKLKLREVQANFESDEELARKMQEEIKADRLLDENLQEQNEKKFYNRRKRYVLQTQLLLKKILLKKVKVDKRMKRKVFMYLKSEVIKEESKEEGQKEIEEEESTKKSNGQKRYFSTLMTVLSIFDREDLNAVYQLGDLMVLFNPDDKDEFWSSQLDWIIVSWKLHSSSGIHTLVTDTGLVIHMLVEKKYPLRKEVLMQMLKLKLESEEENTMALELIKLSNMILALS
ncbi:hypothetical protein Tco_0413129 [Tanacetum coccineum]